MGSSRGASGESRWRRIALAALVAALTVGCPEEEPGEPVVTASNAAVKPPPMPVPDATEADVNALVEGNTRFALDLFGKIRGQEGNLAFSPASISLAFGMTYAGARDETAAQMRDALRFDQAGDAVHMAFGTLLETWNRTEEDGPVLRIANRLFGDATTTFHPSFLDLTLEAYGSELESLNLKGAPEESRERINDWVEEQTEDKILDLLPPRSISTDARLVLVNAIYFKGIWKVPFHEAATRPSPFHRQDGSQVNVPTMSQKENLGYAALEDLEMLRMPYTGDGLAMFILLPREKDGLPELEARLDRESLEEWFAAVRDREVQVLLPSFTIKADTALKLRPLLSELGMPLAFDREADFTGISDERPLYIFDAYHKAFVEVNEEGTEAAAATGVVMGTESAPVNPPPTFRADHPFLFLIGDLRTGSILFLGRVADPSS